MNTMQVARVVVVVAALAAAGCEKSSGSHGDKLSADEAALLADLPAGNAALMGGNYFRLQRDMQHSSLAKLTQAFESSSPGLAAYQDCFLAGDSGMVMMGAFKVDGGRVRMAFAIKGLTIDQIAACAKKAGFPATADADGKYIGLELPTAMGTAKTGYLKLADGALLSTTEMGAGGVPTPTDRATLEAQVAALKSGTAADDKVLVAHLADVDRGKAVWFLGNASSLTNKAGEAYGTIDLAHGLDIDVTVQVTDPALADRITDGVPKARGQMKQLGGEELGGIADRVVFDRKGDRLRFAVNITDAELQKIVDKVAPMMSMMGAMKHAPQAPAPQPAP